VTRRISAVDSAKNPSTSAARSQRTGAAFARKPRRRRPQFGLGEISAAASAEEMIRQIRQYWPSENGKCHPGGVIFFPQKNLRMVKLGGRKTSFGSGSAVGDGISALLTRVDAF